MRGKLPTAVPPWVKPLLWPALAGVFGLLLLSALLALLHLPGAERDKAQIARQRLLVDVATGVVTTGTDAPPPKPEPAPEPSESATPEESATSPAEPIAPSAEASPETAPAATPQAPAGFDVAGPEEGVRGAATGTAAAPAAAEASPTATETPAAATPTPAPPATSSLPANTPKLRTEPLGAALAAPARTKESLVGAPAPEVTEHVDGAVIPRRGESGALPSLLYARPFHRNADQALLAFVVLDAGVDPQSIGLLMGLPPYVTAVWSPYAKSSDTSNSEFLRITGHELWGMLPMMTDRYPNDDPGPLGLVAKMPAEEITRRTREAMAASPGAVGLVLPPNEALSPQKGALATALKEVDDRGLLLLSTHPAHAVSQLTTQAEIAKHIRRADLILDPEPDEAQIKSRLDGVMDAAKQKGEYVVVLSARPQSLQILGAWLKDHPAVEPVTYAPLSAIYQPKEAPPAPKEEAKSESHGAENKEAKPKEKKKEGGH